MQATRDEIQKVPVIPHTPCQSSELLWKYLAEANTCTITSREKDILVKTFKFGMWVYMGNATTAIDL